MNKHGITVWINEPVDILAKRLLPQKDHRPLIQNLSDAELKQFLSDKLAERAHFYLQAAHHLQGADISDAGFAKIIKQHA